MHLANIMIRTKRIIADRDSRKIKRISLIDRMAFMRINETPLEPEDNDLIEYYEEYIHTHLDGQNQEDCLV